MQWILIEQGNENKNWKQEMFVAFRRVHGCGGYDWEGLWVGGGEESVLLCGQDCVWGKIMEETLRFIAYLHL